MSYNPGKNQFSYNAENPFPPRSIFVIDEASMIDISLFAALLEAMPVQNGGDAQNEKPKIFILGDKDQLPSVDAGAVLGELLSLRKNNLVELSTTRRFNDYSEVGRLKNAIMWNNEGSLRDYFADLEKNQTAQKPQKSQKPFEKYFTTWEEWKNAKNVFFAAVNDDEIQQGYPVTIFDLDSPKHKLKLELKLSKKQKKGQIKKIVTNWSMSFYDKLALPDANKTAKEEIISPRKIDFTRSDLTTELDKLWKEAITARILCAERKEERGVEQINTTIRKHILKKLKDAKIPTEDDDYFAGELLLLTKNQGMFNLYNGDSGIVVTFDDNGKESLKYLMVKKEIKSSDSAENSENVSNSEAVQNQLENNVIRRKGSYLFYPLYLLPKDAVETAFAITIHKAQGSGYDAILIFVPEKAGHPLLNRQILYTAITRTSGSTYIVASEASLDAARKNKIERITGIKLVVCNS